MSYRPMFTGVGIIGGYLALLLGPSFYMRRKIGARRWRKVHTLIALAWLLSVVHTLGAGSDASKLWLRLVVLAPGILIVYLLVLRLGSSRGDAARRATRQPSAATTHRPSGAATRRSPTAATRRGSGAATSVVPPDLATGEAR